MLDKSTKLIVASMMLVFCIRSIETAPATKEYYFDQLPRPAEEKNVAMVTKATVSQPSLEDLEQFFKDQQHLVDDKRNSTSDGLNVGQSANHSAISSMLSQLPYGEQLLVVYQMYTILQNAGVGPQAISQLLINSFMPNGK